MKVFEEINLTQFEFWGGARCRAEQLSYEELEQLDFIFEDMYPEGCSATLINDIFWFEFDSVCDWLGLELDENEDIIREEEEE